MDILMESTTALSKTVYNQWWVGYNLNSRALTFTGTGTPTVVRIQDTPTWDFKLDVNVDSPTYGSLISLSEDMEVKQRAIIACVLQRGTIPQLEDVGNRNAEMLTGGVNPITWRAEMLRNVQDLADTLVYMPSIRVEDSEVVVSLDEG